ncbi:galactose-binding domain-like protein [Cladochytrium replicatum]|nr:galactose-binding domain-like protein [Cladochytrium replicatum]
MTSHCSDEHHDHGGQGHHHHDHDHDDEPELAGLQLSLFKQIDMTGVRALNEAVRDSAKSVLKPWETRFDTTAFIESDADEQLIIFIPFTANIKLKSISVRGALDGSGPSRMKAYINREDVDFDSVESIKADQEWDLIVAPPELKTIPDYPTRLAKFTNLRNLTLFFPENFSGSETTKILYIGLKGEYTEISRDPILNTVYELAPNPAKLKNRADISNSHMIQ